MWCVRIDLSSPYNRATAVGSLTIIPLLVWWAGWYPAIMSSDSVDQWAQVLAFEFYNSHPITHTASMWVVSLVWQSPAAIALVQVVLVAGILALVARRLVQIGIRTWLATGAVWVIALLPMTAAMSISIWKDVPFTIVTVWVFTELLLMAKDRSQYWSSWPGPIRLGIALGLMWALRSNGKLTVIVFILAIVLAFRSEWQRLLVMGIGVVCFGIVLPAFLVNVLPVINNPIEPAQVFMPDVASVFFHDRDALSSDDLALVASVAPEHVWEGQYQCGDSGPLIFHPEYDNSVIRSDPASYRALILHTIAGAPFNVAGHRWCASEYLLSPYNRTDTFVHRPPFDIWSNDLGLERAPLSDRAYSVTLWAYQVVEKPNLEWLTWRPAVYVIAGLITYAAVWRRRRLRPLGWIGLLFIIHLANVFGTSPSQEFRYAFGLYLISLASIPIWYLIADPSRAKLRT